MGFVPRNRPILPTTNAQQIRSEPAMKSRIGELATRSKRRSNLSRVNKMGDWLTSSMTHQKRPVVRKV